MGARIPYTSCLSSQTLLAGSHTSSYSSLSALRPCADHDSYNTVVEMFIRETFLTL